MLQLACFGYGWKDKTYQEAQDQLHKPVLLDSVTLVEKLVRPN